MKQKIFLAIGSVILVIFVVVLLFLFFPGGYIKPNPIQNNLTFEQATARFTNILQSEQNNPDILPDCYSKLYDHQAKTNSVIVLYHGYTACPSSLTELAQKLHAQGYTVLTLLQPYHGNKDTLNTAQANVNPHELADHIATSLEIASGLGEDITVFGFSGGGVMASWAAKYYPEVSYGVVASPGYHAAGFPLFLRNGIINLTNLLPAQFWWWDPVAKENIAQTSYYYARYTTKGVGMYLAMGAQLTNDTNVTHGAPALTLLYNHGDPIADAVAAETYANQLSRKNITIETYVIPKEKNVGHGLDELGPGVAEQLFIQLINRKSDTE